MVPDDAQQTAKLLWHRFYGVHEMQGRLPQAAKEILCRQWGERVQVQPLGPRRTALQGEEDVRRQGYGEVDPVPLPETGLQHGGLHRGAGEHDAKVQFGRDRRARLQEQLLRGAVEREWFVVRVQGRGGRQQGPMHGRQGVRRELKDDVRPEVDEGDVLRRPGLPRCAIEHVGPKVRRVQKGKWCLQEEVLRYTVEQGQTLDRLQERA